MFNFTYQKGCLAVITWYVGALMFGFFMLLLISGLYLAFTSGRFSSINMPNFIAGIFTFGLLSVVGIIIQMIFPPFRFQEDALVIKALVFSLYIPWKKINGIRRVNNTLCSLSLSQSRFLEYPIFLLYGVIMGKNCPIILLDIKDEMLDKIKTNIK